MSPQPPRMNGKRPNKNPFFKVGDGAGELCCRLWWPSLLSVSSTTRMADRNRSRSARQSAPYQNIASLRSASSSTDSSASSSHSRMRHAHHHASTSSLRPSPLVRYFHVEELLEAFQDYTPEVKAPDTRVHPFPLYNLSLRWASGPLRGQPASIDDEERNTPPNALGPNFSGMLSSQLVVCVRADICVVSEFPYVEFRGQVVLPRTILSAKGTILADQHNGVSQKPSEILVHLQGRFWKCFWRCEYKVGSISSASKCHIAEDLLPLYVYFQSGASRGLPAHCTF